MSGNESVESLDEKSNLVERALRETETASELAEADRKKMDVIKKEIDIADSERTVQYGVGVQKNISEFADGVLSHVKGKDSGPVGLMLGDLVSTIKQVNVDALSKKKGFFGRLFGGLATEARRLLNRYEKVSGQLDKITKKLGQTQNELSSDLKVLESLFEKNFSYFRDLNLYILAGEEALQEARETRLPELEEKASKSGEVIDKQNLSDYRNRISRFEKRLHDIKLTRTITLQTVPQIRMVQYNNHELINKIQSSILNTIPLWKNQIVIAVSLVRQKMAVGMQKEISDTTNAILQKNAEMLKENASDVTRESERGIVDIETLRKVNDDLITTIEDTIQIQEEGRQKRIAVESELLQIEENLKQSLMNIKK